MLDKTKCSIKAKYANLPFFNEPHCGTNFGFMEDRGFFSLAESLKQPEVMRKKGINYWKRYGFVRAIKKTFRFIKRKLFSVVKKSDID